MSRPTREQLLAELRAEQLQLADELLSDQIPNRPQQPLLPWTPDQQAHHRQVAYRESLAYERAHEGRLCQDLRAVG